MICLIFKQRNICSASTLKNVPLQAYQSSHSGLIDSFHDFSMTDFHNVTLDHFLTALPFLLMLFLSSGNFNSLFSTIVQLTVEKKTAEKPPCNAISMCWKIRFGFSMSLSIFLTFPVWKKKKKNLSKINDIPKN